MPLTAKKLSHAQLTAAAVTQYTVPASTTTRVTELLITNTDTVERVVTVHFVPSGGAADATNRVLSSMSVGAGTTIKIGLDTVLMAGEFISALAGVAAVMNLRISGWEIT